MLYVSLSTAYFTKLKLKIVNFVKAHGYILPVATGRHSRAKTWLILGGGCVSMIMVITIVTITVVSQWSWSSTSSQSWVCLNNHRHHRHDHGCVSMIMVINIVIRSEGVSPTAPAHNSDLVGRFWRKKHGLPCVSYLENNSKITTAGYNGNGLWELRAPSLSARVGLTGSNQDIC